MKRSSLKNSSNILVRKITRFFLKTVKLLGILAGDAYKWFRKLPAQIQAISLLVLVLVVGIAGVIYVINSNKEVVVKAEDYSPNPEREILFTCTDSTIDPSQETVRGGEFIRFRFKNEGTKPTSFSVRGEETTVGSTISIAPNTIASFSWRVPPKIKDKELVSSCVQTNGGQLEGEIKFIEKD